MATYDLTQRMIPYLDRHLSLQLLGFLEKKKFYNSKDIARAKFELAKDTDLVDLLQQCQTELGTDSKDVAQKRKQVDSTLAERRSKAEPVLKALEEASTKLAEMGKSEQIRFLQDKYNITNSMICHLYNLAESLYAKGDYNEAVKYLDCYSQLTTDDDNRTSTLWGCLSADILSGSWENAARGIKDLKESIDDSNTNPLFLLVQRTWLIHAALFVFVNYDKCHNDIVDMCFLPQYINTIQTICPWILRYLTVAVVINKRKKSQMKELVKVIEQETYQYKDPVTEFIEALYVRFDLDGAQKKLKECGDVLQDDYFLASLKETFMENARQHISETYCRIHQKINIKDMSNTLNLNPEEGEKWIVNLIRDTRADAKIDFEENTVIMNTPVTSVYQQVIERTKGLSMRSQALASSLKRQTTN